MSDPQFHVFGGRPSVSTESRELTVRDYARLEQVTIRTVWNWIGKDAIMTRRTPGGGVRVVITENR